MLEVKNVVKRYAGNGGFLGRKDQTILSDISFNVASGECMGLVGESGSGKSTLSRLILGLEKPCSGEILMKGQPVSAWKKSSPGQMSVVFQDYTTSVNPGFTVARALAEPLQTMKKSAGVHSDVPEDSGDPTDNESYLLELLDRVALSKTVLNRYPHELSGGQVQRVCIARAIATRPSFILFDEALSSLDVPVQAQVLELLSDLKQDLQLTYFFIAHDLMAVASLSDRIMFLHQGKLVESLETTHLHKARNEYAKALLDSARLFLDEMGKRIEIKMKLGL